MIFGTFISSLSMAHEVEKEEEEEVLLPEKNMLKVFDIVRKNWWWCVGPCK